jgi:caa(3)-type oxidase subunit IV
MTEHSTEAIAHAEGHGDASYVKVWAILLALLVVSVIGPLAEVPILTLVTAFGVAGVKAYLVVRHFMHLTVEPKYVGYVLATCVAFMVLLFAGTAPDVMRHEGQNWANHAAQDEVRRASAGLPGAPGPAEPVAPEVAFQRTCAPCHGTAGGGDGAAAASLDPKPADFTAAAFWETRDVAHVAKVIREGGVAVGRSPIMPAFGAQFDAEAADALADYIRASFGTPSETEPVDEDTTPTDEAEAP